MAMSDLIKLIYLVWHGHCKVHTNWLIGLEVLENIKNTKCWEFV